MKQGAGGKTVRDSLWEGATFEPGLEGAGHTASGGRVLGRVRAGTKPKHMDQGAVRLAWEGVGAGKAAVRWGGSTRREVRRGDVGADVLCGLAQAAVDRTECSGP